MLYYNNKKLGGILIESKKNKSNFIFNIGIGINVNETIEDFPSYMQKNATSLKILSGKTVQRELLLAHILNSIDEKLYNIQESSIIKEWMKYCNHLDSEISVKHNGENIKGIFKQINKKGQAIISKNGENFIFDGPIISI